MKVKFKVFKAAYSGDIKHQQWPSYTMEVDIYNKPFCQLVNSQGKAMNLKEAELFEVLDKHFKGGKD
jgi:hypothetical protein